MHKTVKPSAIFEVHSDTDSALCRWSTLIKNLHMTNIDFNTKTFLLLCALQKGQTRYAIVRGTTSPRRQEQ
jgi:hypothetical protein